jgi:hypothetical protein
VKVRDATRRVAALAAAVVACSVCAERPAVAQNRGVYPLGMSALAAGTLPDTGMTYANQLIVYSRDRAKDDAGRTVATGANAVVMDMNTFTWVSAWSIGGFRYAASATLPFAWNSLTSDAEGAINQGRGFADSYYLPLIVGRAGDRGAVRAQYGFLAPTGKFSAGATDNVGSGYWTHTLSSGQTLHLASGQRVTLSAFELYELHTEQRGSNIRPADTFDLDASLMGQVRARRVGGRPVRGSRTRRRAECVVSEPACERRAQVLPRARQPVDVRGILRARFRRHHLLAARVRWSRD